MAVLRFLQITLTLFYQRKMDKQYLRNDLQKMQFPISHAGEEIQGIISEPLVILNGFFVVTKVQIYAVKQFSNIVLNKV